jgi:hypothetical protein
LAIDGGCADVAPATQDVGARRGDYGHDRRERALKSLMAQMVERP